MNMVNWQNSIPEWLNVYITWKSPCRYADTKTKLTHLNPTGAKHLNSHKPARGLFEISNVIKMQIGGYKTIASGDMVWNRGSILTEGELEIRNPSSQKAWMMIRRDRQRETQTERDTERDRQRQTARQRD